MKYANVVAAVIEFTIEPFVDFEGGNLGVPKLCHRVKKGHAGPCAVNSTENMCSCLLYSKSVSIMRFEASYDWDYKEIF